MANTLIGKETANEELPTTQVYKATHDGAGNRLSYRHRSFISFSYGEKIIEDFGLIACTDGDRLNRNLYADFDDITETHETLDGQVYWGSHFTSNKLDLTLTTDGITAKQLDDFKQWFIPNKNRELILMEHPNRAIMARVAVPPKFSMLPFSTISKIKIAGVDYDTEVTLFKGNISLSFVMDEPYWYAKNNLIGPVMQKSGANDIINLEDDPYKIRKMLIEEYKKKEKGLYVQYVQKNVTMTGMYKFEKMTIKDGGRWWLIECEDYEGGKKTFVYPSREDKQKNSAKIISLFGASYTLTTETENNTLSTVEQDAAKDIAKIILEDNIPHLMMIQDQVLLGGNSIGAGNVESRVFNNSSETVNGLAPNTGARVQYYGYVAFEEVEWSGNLQLDSTHSLYLFYSGTAPSKPTLEFTFTPTFENNYISLPRNQYSDPANIKKGRYNFISFDDHRFYFTTPSLITGYNQAVYIVKEYKNGQSVEELIMLIKENINEYYARAWAIACIKSLEAVTVNNSFKTNFIKRMKFLLCDENGITPNPITCFFDSKHGTATVTYSGIRKANNTLVFKQVENKTVVSNCSIVPEVQNAGDMVKSDYLIIEGRCYPSFSGYISSDECHVIKTNFDSEHPLTNVVLTFQNMYY